MAAHLPRHLRDRAAQPGPADPTRSSTSAPTPSPSVLRLAPLERPGGGAAPPSACRCSRSTPTAAHEFDVLAFNLSAELTYATCSTASTWPASRCRPPSAAPSRWWRRAATHLQPRAAGRLPRLRGPRRRRGGRVRDHRWSAVEGAAAPSPAARPSCGAVPVEGVYVPSMYEVDYDGPHIGRSRPATPTSPRAGREAHDRRPRRLALPAPPARAAHRGGARPAQRRGVPGLHRGCRFCQAGMITAPVRERPAEQVRTMVSEGLRRTGYDEVALTSLSTADFSGIEDVVRASWTTRRRAGRPRSACPACGSTPSPSASPPRSRRPAAPGSRSPPRPAPGACARSSTSSSARRTSTARSRAPSRLGWRRVKLYFLTGLPSRPTRTRSASSTWPATASTSGGATPGA